MISLKRSLRLAERQAGALQALDLLLEGMGSLAVKADQGAYDDFRKEMNGIAAKVDDAADEAEMMVHCGAAVESLRDYNRAVSGMFAAHRTELHKMVEMLTTSLAALSASATTAVDQLTAIRADLVRATELDDIRLIRTKLGGCLKAIEAEAARQEESARNKADEMLKRIAAAQEMLETKQVHVDPVTGLPGRLEIEAAIGQTTTAAEPQLAVVFVIERLNQINGRYGHAVGDEVIRRMVSFIREQLGPIEHLYRWSGPAFVASLPRETRVVEAQREVSRMLAKKFQVDIQTTDRSLLLLVIYRAAVFPFAGPPPAFLQRIEDFVDMKA